MNGIRGIRLPGEGRRAVCVEDKDRIAVIALEAARRMIIGHMEHRD